jgi:hypothetical protein
MHTGKQLMCSGEHVEPDYLPVHRIKPSRKVGKHFNTKVLPQKMDTAFPT